MVLLLTTKNTKYTKGGALLAGRYNTPLAPELSFPREKALDSFLGGVDTREASKIHSVLFVYFVCFVV